MTRTQLQIDNHVAVVTLDRPDKLNALDLPMFRDLVRVGASLIDASQVRAVVLTGAGRGFCAGLDIQAVMASGLQQASSELLDHREGPANLAQRVAWIWQEIPVPVICALHGMALGGGLQIALGCDIRIAHPATQLSVRELHWGLIPDMAISKTLLRCVPNDVAKWLTFSAHILDAVEGQRLGLVTQVSEDPFQAAIELAHTIAGHNPQAIQAAKHLLSAAPALSTAEAFELESELQRPLLGSPNQLEAAMANFQKREPLFK